MTDTLDRAVASIGNSALTESDVQAECRFELFLNGRPAEAAPDAAKFERVRDRLIDQKLLEQEAEAENLKPPDLSRQATEMLNQARAKYATEALYQGTYAFKLACGAAGRLFIETAAIVMSRICYSSQALLPTTQHESQGREYFEDFKSRRIALLPRRESVKGKHMAVLHSLAGFGLLWSLRRQCLAGASPGWKL